jgi:hypothetical protein
MHFSDTPMDNHHIQMIKRRLYPLFPLKASWTSNSHVQLPELTALDAI